MPMPTGIEDLKVISDKIRKIAVMKIAQLQFDEDIKELTTEIKEDFGRDIDVKGISNAVVDASTEIRKAQNKLTKAEECVQAAEVLSNYIDKGAMADDAEKWGDIKRQGVQE